MNPEKPPIKIVMLELTRRRKVQSEIFEYVNTRILEEPFKRTRIALYSVLGIPALTNLSLFFLRKRMDRRMRITVSVIVFTSFLSFYMDSIRRDIFKLAAKDAVLFQKLELLFDLQKYIPDDQFQAMKHSIINSRSDKNL